jgi:hypothetical protein
VKAGVYPVGGVATVLRTSPLASVPDHSGTPYYAGSLTQGEAALRDILPDSLGAGERESIAVARERHGTVLSNETRVAHCCRQNQIPCVRLLDILRALWEGVVSQQEVQDTSTICG